MSYEFRELLRKVGSGQHTSESLTREESARAALMMLKQEATPAQIGAFMISHRIKRPTPEELAGMLDAYDELGPALAPIHAPYPTVVLNSPYDGRSRTAPLGPITALILAAHGCPALLHGGGRMPTKYGLPFVEIWQHLGVDWTPLSLQQVQTVFEQTRLGFVYLPHHFPLAEGLTPYRDQLGKRPPQATLELMWCPYQGEVLMACGYVHPPTEQMIQKAIAQFKPVPLMTIKGLEGSCDLPRDRTCIVGIEPNTDGIPGDELERLLLHPRDFDLAGRDVPLESDALFFEAMDSVLAGTPSELMQSAIWNGGFYLWRTGVCASLEAGLAEAETCLKTGQARQQLEALRRAVAEVRQSDRTTSLMH